MSNSLIGKTAVVTGGAKGIGLAISKTLAESGANVILLGRDLAALQEAGKKIAGSELIKVDVSSKESVEKGFKQTPTVDILVNNAGIVSSAPFERTAAEDWEQSLRVNLMGAVHCTQQVLPGMKARRFGRIVNIGSTASIRGYTYVSAYCASKHALLGFTKALALEVATSGVTVNAVCPGFSDTNMLEDSVSRIAEATGMDAPRIRKQLMSTNPLGRFVTPAEIAACVLWLCGSEAAGVNGQAIPIDGGETAR